MCVKRDSTLINLHQDTKGVQNTLGNKMRAFGWSTTSIGRPLFAIDWLSQWLAHVWIFIVYVCSLCHWPKCEKIEGSTDFSFLTQFWQFVWISTNSKNSLKNQCFPHLSSENCEINSIKSYSPRVFQKHQECPQILIHFRVLILFSLQWENGSIINIFHTVAPNSLNSTQNIII